MSETLILPNYYRNSRFLKMNKCTGYIILKKQQQKNKATRINQNHNVTCFCGSSVFVVIFLKKARSCLILHGIRPSTPMPPLLQAATTKFSLGAAISNNNIQDKTQHDGRTGSDLSVSPTRLELRPF